MTSKPIPKIDNSTTTSAKSPKKISDKKISETSSPITQKFFATFTVNSVIVKCNNISFGINKEIKLEKFTRNVETPAMADVLIILNFIKDLMKLNVSCEQIANRLNKTQLKVFSQTLRQYAGAISKPI